MEQPPEPPDLRGVVSSRLWSKNLATNYQGELEIIYMWVGIGRPGFIINEDSSIFFNERRVISVNSDRKKFPNRQFVTTVCTTL